MENVKHFEDCPRHNLGMDIFLSRHNGFSGRIKMRPEDFSVTEIDLSGKPVQLDGREDFQSLPCQISEEDIDFYTDGAKSSDDSLSRSSDGLSSRAWDSMSLDDLTDLEDLAPILEDVVGKEVMEHLRTFSKLELNGASLNTCVKPSGISSGSLNFQTPRASDGVSAPGKSFFVGIFSEKQERTFVHKAIQCLYPHLVTSTAKLRDSASSSVHVSTNPAYWDFQNLLADHQVGKLFRFARSKFSARTISIDADCMNSKEQRTAIHRLISKHFGKFLETKTCPTASGQQAVVVRFREKFARKNNTGVKRKAEVFDAEASGAVFTGFTLEKRNLETLDALQRLARVLRVKPSDFSYAGVKDKKAITLQSVAVKGVSPDRVKQLISGANLPGIAVGNVRPVLTAIHVGDLTGNLFDILVRDVHLGGDGETPGEEALERDLLWQKLDSCFTCVKERGFVNYFGEQRFGQSLDGESQSAAIGQFILAGNYQDAVSQILMAEGDKDDLVNRAKRHFLRTRNAKEALRLLPRCASREGLILRALHRHGTERDGCTRALHCIPHAMRQLYVHAFGGLVWNRMASERLRLYGYRAVVGDLVLMGDEKRGARDKIREVSEDDVKLGTFSIRDVVLPLPGNNIRYPSNRMGEAYTKCLSEMGLGSCTYRLHDLQLNIPGDYRRLIEWPEDLVWDLEKPSADDGVQTITGYQQETYHKSDPPEDRQHFADERARPVAPKGNLSYSDDLLQTDRRKPADSDKAQNESKSPKGSEMSSSEFEDRQCISNCKTTGPGANLRVTFRLPSSTYATVFLRELMKN
ncbi:pseudouridylate synthase 7 homolog-like protein [Acanthaster planci]|uniref:Pseudouridylate synthase 7 homolog-like protein n=1 Tax=Acanthaster planci TaxID=133434 RepID=A0A8B7Z1V8_ACAPL|nr:pseudouridylate synthase 7 homolog-like protein [Acanthaster planci]